MQRRRVFRALVGYGIAAFAVLQIIEPVMHGLHWPDEVLSYVVVALAAGFPVVVTLAWVFDFGGEARAAPAAPSGKRVALLLAAVGVLAAAPGVGWYLFWRQKAQTPARIATAAAPSIAVLPLLNLSRDPDQEYFADGLAEELLDLLAKLPGLHVAGRTSSFAFKGKNQDLRSIGETLNVSTILEGSVRKAGDQIRITTQLINAADGYHLWSETYDRKLTDVFAIQDEIARAVVAALKLKLLPGQTPTSRDHRTAQPEVYTQYLLGKRYFSQSNRDAYVRARQAFKKALELDPGFAPAWAGLADATLCVADSADDTQTMLQDQREAVAAAEKAVALAPDLAEAFAARGLLRALLQWDWPGAQSDYERALALAPEDADVMSHYAFFVLEPIGLLPKAVAMAQRATELDPLSDRCWIALGALLIESGKVEPGRAMLKRALELNPQGSYAPVWLATASLLEGNPAAALSAIEHNKAEYFRLTFAAMAEHDLGHAQESRKALEQLIAKHAHESAYQIAEVFAWIGEKDRAFEWLDRAWDQRDAGITDLKADVLLRKLRDDTRYTALLRKMNLPAE
jgi:TolB-like protein